jgi:hypothetical protein
MNFNLDKINFSALLLMLLFGLLLSSCEQQQAPQGLANIPEDCQDLAFVDAWVFLTYVAEVHPDRPGLPGGYTAVIKIPFRIEQAVPFAFKETDAEILGRLRSPWPDEYLIGQIKSYEIQRKYCKEVPEEPEDKPIPKKPDPKKR